MTKNGSEIEIAHSFLSSQNVRLYNSGKMPDIAMEVLSQLHRPQCSFITYFIDPEMMKENRHVTGFSQFTSTSEQFIDF